ARRADRGAWCEASDIRKSSRPDAAERAEALQQDASRAYGRALRDYEQSLELLAIVPPASRRGAIEMLTAALAEFSEPFGNYGNVTVFCSAEVPSLIRSIRDAIELWESEPPPLKAGEAR
uniref:hypothetical protein n=1 Tax=Rhodoblastus sp. TaxID=1962975 RepID=UPI003F9B5C7C